MIFIFGSNLTIIIWQVGTLPSPLQHYCRWWWSYVKNILLVWLTGCDCDCVPVLSLSITPLPVIVGQMGEMLTYKSLYMLYHQGAMIVGHHHYHFTVCVLKPLAIHSLYQTIIIIYNTDRLIVYVCFFNKIQISMAIIYFQNHCQKKIPEKIWILIQ